MENKPYIGQKDRQVQIIEQTEVSSATGAPVKTNVVKANPFAYMKDVSGGEDVEGKVRHLVNRTYTIRYNSDIATNGFKYFLLDGGAKFFIEHVKEIGRKDHLELICRLYE